MAISLKSGILGRIALLALSAGVFYAIPAQAQQIPGPADAGQIERNLRDRTALPDVTPDIQIKNISVGQAPAGADQITFTLKDLQLDGMTAYRKGELRNVYGSRLGTTMSLADLYQIAADMTAKYRNDGYILTQVIVPPQTIENGTARLQVVEGSLDTLTIKGDEAREGRALDLMRRYASHLKTGGPLNSKELERVLLLINDLPGVSARSVISPSATKTGMADLTIVVERDPFDGFVGLDNYGSRFLGRWEGLAGASTNSLFGLNERISGQIVYAPHGPINDHELAFISGAYWMPIGSIGTNLELTYSYTDTEPGLSLRDFDVEGKSHYAAMTLRHPFIRTRELNLTGRVLLDGRRVESENNIPDNRTDDIRALRAGGRLEFADTLLSGGVSTIDIELAKGLDILGASDENDADLTRPDGDPQFFKMEAEVQRLQRLTQEFNLLVSAHGQLSNGAQLSSEEFAVGGSTYGRGFDPAEITGDDGVAGKVELQWNPGWNTNWMNSSQVFGFWDAGKVWNNDVVGDTDESLTSTGLGVRANFSYDIQSEAYIALPLTRDIQAENDDDARFFLSLTKRF